MPRLRAEAVALRQKTGLFIAAAAGAAFAGYGGTLSRWCADPGLGWGLALAACALGFGAALRVPAEVETSPGWALGGALAALGAPALLRVLGLSAADPGRLQSPLGGAGEAAFELGQASVLAAVAAFAWTRAVRSGGRRAAAAAAAGAAAAVAAFRRVDPPAVLAGAALLALAAAELAEKPWSERAAAPLRARVFAAAAGAGLLLAWLAPGLLRDVWMARLHAAYPGGGYLTYADDGAHAWAAYRFSTGDALALRDGTVETLDPQSVRLALCSLLGQLGEGRPRGLLIVRSPQPQAAAAAFQAGASVTVDGLTSAQSAAFDALAGAQWRAAVSTRAAEGKPNAALIVLPPRGSRWTGTFALKRLRARLAPDAAVALLLPAGSEGDADAAARAAASVFGAARAADLPRGALVIASSSEVVADPQLLFGRLPDAARSAYSGGDRELSSALRWRAAVAAK